MIRPFCRETRDDGVPSRHNLDQVSEGTDSVVKIDSDLESVCALLIVLTIPKSYHKSSVSVGIALLTLIRCYTCVCIA